MAAVKAKSSILLTKNILSETSITADQILRGLKEGRVSLMNLYIAVYTTARSVKYTSVFRLDQHIDRLCMF